MFRPILLLVHVFVLEVTVAEDQSSCVPLEQCAPLLALWESRYIMNNTREATNSLRRAHCGFLSATATPLFHCPDNTGLEIGRHVMDVAHMDEQECQGSVKLFSEDPEPQFVTTETVARVGGSFRTQKASAVGNCCWRLHSKKRFKGRSIIVRSGLQRVSIGKVKSIKKLENCSS